MDRFSKFNPYVTFLFFILQILLTLMVFNPCYLALSLFSAVLYKIRLDGKGGAVFFLKFCPVLIVVTAVFNMLFVHYGMTVLFNLFDMNYTLESLFYGFCQGVMFSAVTMWFSCYSKVVTAEKFLAVFGRIAPNSSLVFSMVLSFIPRLIENSREISDAHMLIDNSDSRLKKSIKNFSALLTLTLEQSVETADSMKARGFGGKRSSYSKYPFSVIDAVCIVLSAILFVILCVMKSLGKMIFIFEPMIKMSDFSPFAFVLFLVFSFLPVIINLTEDMRWLYLKRKI